MQTTKKRVNVNNFALTIASRWVEGGKIALRSSSSDLIQALARLERFRLLCQSTWKVRLPIVKRSWSLKSLKDFCDGILDKGCVCHEWRTSLLRENHASLRVRVAVASSLFLFRKVIPQEMTKSEVDKRLRAYIDKMSTPQPTISPPFVRHVQRWMRKLFKGGWDKRWSSRVDSFTLPTSSCLENPRKEGGPRGLDRARLRTEYRAFVEGTGSRIRGDTKPMMIWTGGKWRLVTKFSARRSFLTPLHHLIYDHLSTKNWLLRGEATRDEFEDFSRREGEVFVSGDYESATDNLNISLTHLVLDEMRRTSHYVPPHVWREARLALVARFPDGRKQSRGQLMGSLLSFPLLCLVNFLTFKWSIARRVPLKINGDDIVFRCRPAEADRWFKDVEQSGLVVSRGKTLVSRNVFSLNSTFFLPQSEGAEVCPVIRSTCLFGGVEEPLQVAGRLKGVYCGGGRARDQIHAFALKEMSKGVWSSQRSVMRGLGCRTSWKALYWAGLKEREVFYNELLSEPDLPPRKRVWCQNAIPKGFERVPARSPSDADHPDFAKELIEACWTVEPKKQSEQSNDVYWEVVRSDTFKFVPPPARRFARMAGMTDAEADQFYNRRTNTVRRNERKVWVKVPVEESTPPRRGVGY
uniref:RNA-dependent RNA polymerase n=1 Tax=Ourmia-like virus sp. TaxID=2689985 RepID=A0A6B9I988_9VIRU|nr:RNA-dependent RNA polymerase [Ourmia-like virus sp.]